MLGSLNGEIAEADRLAIPAGDEGLLRGDGAFEVLRVYAGRPFALDDHLARLAGSARGLRLPADVDAVRAEAEALLAAAAPGDCALRIVLTRGGRRLLLLEPLKPAAAALRLASVTYAPTRILDGIKSLSYAANMLASRLARERDADEALLVTPHGRVLEAPTSAFFCALDERVLVTAPLQDHVLDSITRRRILGLVEVHERPVTLDEVRGAREAFLASTLREVQPVAAVDGHALPAVPGPLTRAAAEAFRAHVAAAA